MKKLLAVLLAVSMMFSVSLVAFADISEVDFDSKWDQEEDTKTKFTLDYVGYNHSSVNVILAADREMTVGELTERGHGQAKDMNYFAIAVVNQFGIITHTDFTIGRPDGVKTDTVVPEGSYLVGINKNKGEDFDKFTAAAEVGKSVELFGVDLDEVKALKGNLPVKDAYFTVSDSKAAKISLDYKGYFHQLVNVIFASDKDEDTTIGELTKKGCSKVRDMNHFAIAVVGADNIITEVNTKLDRPDGIKTETVVPKGSYVIGVNRENKEDFDAFTAAAAVGKTVKLLNVTVDEVRETKTSEPLTDAAFMISEDTEIKEEETTLFDLYTGDSDKTYVAGEEINVIIKARNIDLDKVGRLSDGLSLVAFDLEYNPNLVVPAFEAKEDKDGDKCDFTGLLDGTVKEWEGFGKVDLKEGKCEFAFYDTVAKGKHVMYDNVTNKDDEIVIKIPFKVVADTKFADIFFGFSRVLGSNRDGSKSLFKGTYENVTVKDSGIYVQPDDITEVPEEAKPIDYAGYKHEGSKTVIMAADQDTTLGDLVLRGDPANFVTEEPDMNYWYVIIADKDGFITYTNFTLGRDDPKGNKKDVKVPAGSIVIATHGAHPDSELIRSAAEGDQVLVYNVNLDSVAKISGYRALTDAAYEIIPSDIVLKDDAPASYENNIVTLFANNVSIDDFKAMFESDITVLDKEGNEVTSGLVGTNMTIDFGEGIGVVVLGDINGDGKVNTADYTMLKRAVLETYELNDLQTIAGAISNGTDVSAKDYTKLKRFCLDTFDIYQK